MIKAVIFDMDGLMIDSERITYEGYKEVCAKLGYKITKEFYVSMLGLTEEKIWKIFREEFGEDIPIKEIMKKVHEYMEERFQTEGVPIKKGLMDLLEYLKEKQYKTIVATSSRRERVDKILQAAGIEHLFDTSICGNEVEQGKPNPEIFIKACEKLEVSPKEAVVLEDSEYGILAASCAGILCICIPDMKQPQPDFSKKAIAIVESLNDVKEYLELY